MTASVHRMLASSRWHSSTRCLATEKLEEMEVGSIWFSSPTTPSITLPSSRAMRTTTVGRPSSSRSWLISMISCCTATAVLTATALPPSKTAS